MPTNYLKLPIILFPTTRFEADGFERNLVWGKISRKSSSDNLPKFGVIGESL